MAVFIELLAGALKSGFERRRGAPCLLPPGRRSMRLQRLCRRLKGSRRVVCRILFACNPSQNKCAIGHQAQCAYFPKRCADVICTSSAFCCTQNQREIVTQREHTNIQAGLTPQSVPKAEKRCFAFSSKNAIALGPAPCKQHLPRLELANEAPRHWLEVACADRLL